MMNATDEMKLSVAKLLLLTVLAAALWGCDDAEEKPSKNTEPLTDTQFIAWMTQEMETAEIPGMAVAIVSEGKPVWQHGFGYANLETMQPVTPHTPFPLASVSKTVIGTVLMQLEEKGMINLDDDINSFNLPFRVGHPGFDGRSFPLRRLTSHTSGIIDNDAIYNCTYYLEADGSSLSNHFYPGTCPGTPPVDTGQFLADYLAVGGAFYDAQNNFSSPQSGAPETHFNYTNIGAALAAYAIETKTGIPFDQLCEENIFSPLGMTETHWHSSQFADPAVISRVHLMINNEPMALPPYSFTTWADGGLRSSANDMARFLAAISNGGALGDVRILSASGVSQMIASQTDGVDMGETAATGEYYGTFWSGIGSMVGHDGGDPGITTEMYFDPQKKKGFVMLINLDEKEIPRLDKMITETIRFTYTYQRN